MHSQLSYTYILLTQMLVYRRHVSIHTCQLLNLLEKQTHCCQSCSLQMSLFPPLNLLQPYLLIVRFLPILLTRTTIKVTSPSSSSCLLIGRPIQSNNELRSFSNVHTHQLRVSTPLATRGRLHLIPTLRYQAVAGQSHFNLIFNNNKLCLARSDFS